MHWGYTGTVPHRPNQPLNDTPKSCASGDLLSWAPLDVLTFLHSGRQFGSDSLSVFFFFPGLRIYNTRGMTCSLQNQVSVGKNKQLQGWQLTRHDVRGAGGCFPSHSSQCSAAPCGAGTISARLVHPPSPWRCYEPSSTHG